MRVVPDTPYKGLAPFGDSPTDAMLFFGRGHERDAVVANLLASRLTVLYGPSGVGKSSLLRAGVAQRLRAVTGTPTIVHDAWADEPAEALAASVRAACPDLGPTAGLVDTVAAAAQQHGEVYLLLDQFEDYFAHHPGGSLGHELPELLSRPGLRVNVLIALRDDALAELDVFTGRLPGLFGNLLRLERLERREARSAVVGPLERFGELTRGSYQAEPALVEALLDEVAVEPSGLNGDAPAAAGDPVEAPFLQLVLERLWDVESAAGSTSLRLETFRRLGGAEPILRDHVQGTLERLPEADRALAALLMRHLVTPSGAKTSHAEADLAGYCNVSAERLHPLLESLARDRLVRPVEGVTGGPERYEIFHDVLAQPLLAWRAGFELEAERGRARRQRLRLLAIVGVSLVALAVLAVIAVFALVQRHDAKTAATRAQARELSAEALAGLSTDPVSSVELALRAARLEPGAQTEAVLRSSLLAMRELGVIRTGGAVVATTYAPDGRLLVASSNGSAAVYKPDGTRLVAVPGGVPLTRAAWSPDGASFTTGDSAGTVTIRRARDGRVVARLHTPAPISVLAYAGGELLAASGAHVRLLSPGGRPIRTISVPGAVVAAGLSPDGRSLVVATKRRGVVTTRVLDAKTGRVRKTLPERGIGSIGFSPDGRLLVTGSTDKTARLWALPAGRLVHVLPNGGHVLAEAFSPDGTSLVTSSSDGAASLWDVATGARTLLLVGATGAANDAAFSPDGKQVVVGFGDHLARIYSTQDGRLLAPLAGHGGPVTGVAFDPSGREIVTGSTDGTARLWSSSAGDVLEPIDKRRGPVDARFAGANVLTVAGRIARLITPSGAPLESFSAPAPIVAAAAHGTMIAVVDTGGRLFVFTSHGLGRTLAGVDSVAFAADGTLIASSRSGRIRLIAPAGPQVREIRAGAPIAAVSSSGARFLARTASGDVLVYGLDGTLVQTLRAHAVLAALSPDGSTVATARGRDVETWNVATGKLLHRLTGHRSLVTDVEFSPDGKTLVTSSDDHDARLWDPATGKLLHILTGHFFPVRTASFSPDGRWVVTASQFTAGLWDATTGGLVLYLTGHTAPLTGATFGPGGTEILTGSEDGTARIVACEICRPLAGLEQVAESRVARLR